MSSTLFDLDGKEKEPVCGIRFHLDDQRPEEKRFGGIDVLRGLSILFVLLLHINLRIRFNKLPYAKLLPKEMSSAIAWNGVNGVTIFFAISGFLITTMALRRWGSLGKIELKSFYRLRFARIMPLLGLLLAILCGLHWLGYPEYVVSPQQGGLGRAVAAALTFHVNWLEGSKGYLPASWDVLWSLSIEEIFYLGFPLLCLGLKRTRWIAIALLLFIVSGPLARLQLASNEIWQEKSYLGNMDCIALGCLAALLLPWLKERRASGWGLQIPGIAMMALILYFKHLTNLLHLYKTGMDVTILAMGVCLVILGIMLRSRESSWVTKPFRWMGRYSYEIYLTHMFVVLTTVSLFHRYNSPIRWGYCWYLLMVLLSAVLGMLVAKFYSEPLNQLLRKAKLEQ